jgi:hypothetical protein
MTVIDEPGTDVRLEQRERVHSGACAPARLAAALDPAVFNPLAYLLGQILRNRVLRDIRQVRVLDDL